MLKRFKNKFIGDKAFYKMLIAIFLPIIFQEFITQFVGLLDNIMVGSIGNDEMIGVSLGNQLIFVFNLAVFGSLSGASIFATQYFGAKDKGGYQQTFKFKLLIVTILFIIAMSLFLFLNEQLIGIFINSVDGEYSDPAKVLQNGKDYLLIMIFGLWPFAIKEMYASTLREQKETLVPMISGIIAICVNLLFNFLLIYGKFGFPKLGVKGAAIATIISRFVELILVSFYAHDKKEKFPFLIGIYKNPIVKPIYFKKFILKTIMLLSNETLWSLGLTIMLKYYSYRGLDVIAARNICNTVNNLFVIIGGTLGNATGIILGNLLGSNDIEGAKNAAYKSLFASVIIALTFAIFEFGLGFVIPLIYNTSNEIKHLATEFIMIQSVILVFNVFNTVSYFILRCGGRILLTMFFDSFFIWLVRIPLAIIIGKYTNISVIWMMVIVDGAEALKLLVGYTLVNKGIWLKQII